MSFLHDMYGERGRSISGPRSPIIIGDKSAYLSPLDRTVVEGRSAHRDHMKRHGVVEAGDMKITKRTDEPTGIRQDIQRAIQESNR